MSKKVAVGGFGDDWQSWLAIVTLLGSLGFVPKDWRPALGMAGSVATAYKILKWLGWL